jgi:hypothetical protein
MFKLDKTAIWVLMVIVSLVILAITALADVDSLFAYITLAAVIVIMLFGTVLIETEEQQ